MVLACSATTCVGQIAPIYNIALVLVAFYLIIKLVRMKDVHKSIYLDPWYYLCAVIGIFLLESLITAMKFFNIITEQMVPRWFNAVFELMMIILIIYMLFTQLNHVDDRYRKKKAAKKSTTKSTRK